jgi:hypothetical protein
MNSPITSEFTVSAKESEAFARLSGDYNPLHLDAIAARRTPFAGTVVHGIHLVLKAFDLLPSLESRAELEPTEISGTFNHPVRTAAYVQVTATIDAEHNRIRFAGESERTPAFLATMTLGTTRATPQPELLDCAFPASTPLLQSFPPMTAAGSVPRCLSRAILAQLFPALNSRRGCDWIADLLATSQIVGMRCPGLESIYSTFKLRRIEIPAARASMKFDLENYHARFRMVRMHVTGGALQGSVEAFYRPRPVEQRRLAEIVALVPANAYQSQNALVIGGSRGLGELTAKIVLAGGGAATLTYAQGAADAERICAEARQLGKRCTAQQLDVARIANLSHWVDTTPYTHVYFFASPAISNNSTPYWNHALFERFAHFYVASFAMLAERLLTAQSTQDRAVRFLYPSTIFLDSPQNGFAEYCAAKAAGEVLCDSLSKRFGVAFMKPRLPRMRTDQTNALLGSAAQDPFPILLDMVNKFHS